MKIRLLYFASLRETLGSGGELDWQPAEASPPDAGALRAWLQARSAIHAEALAPGRGVRIAVDQALADEATLLHDGAEVAFFPPVTGG